MRKNLLIFLFLQIVWVIIGNSNNNNNKLNSSSFSLQFQVKPITFLTNKTNNFVISGLSIQKKQENLWWRW